MVLTKRLRLVVLLRCYLDVDHLPRYLISKGSLLLTLFDAEGQQQLLSLQEATQLMVRFVAKAVHFEAPCCMLLA